MSDSQPTDPVRYPNCSSEDSGRVIYGLPDWICNTCNHEWQTPDSFCAKAWAEHIELQRGSSE